jgi:hypothetical protein
VIKAQLKIKGLVFIVMGRICYESIEFPIQLNRDSEKMNLVEVLKKWGGGNRVIE